jgi:hypothetical protein
MKNRLQFNRHYAEYQSREEALTAFRARITDPDFIPLIGEPIVLRYKDENDKLQLILAVGKRRAGLLMKGNTTSLTPPNLTRSLPLKLLHAKNLMLRPLRIYFSMMSKPRFPITLPA